MVLHVFSYNNYPKNKIDSEGNFSLEETLPLYVIILIKSVFLKYQNDYYNIFLKNDSIN